MRQYYILNNGGWPYIVEIYNDEYHFVIKENNDKARTIYKSSFLKKFLGKNTDGKEIGNSILFLVSINVANTKFKYLYIGSEIYLFTSNIPITKYYSPIGNSASPYPYAKNKDYSYLMVEQYIVDNNDLSDIKEDPYKFYYKTTMNKKNIQTFQKFYNIKVIARAY